MDLCKREKLYYMKVQVRYLHGRLLFRISDSPYVGLFSTKKADVSLTETPALVMESG